MNDYLQSFRELVLELYNNPNCILLEYTEYNPIEVEKIIQIEKKLGFEIPSSIKSFYLQTNGLRLGWIHLKDSFYNKDKHMQMTLDDTFQGVRKMSSPGFYPASNVESASINIMAMHPLVSTQLTPKIFRSQS